jgi:hypothetical protein
VQPRCHCSSMESLFKKRRYLEASEPIEDGQIGNYLLTRDAACGIFVPHGEVLSYTLLVLVTRSVTRS